MIFGIELAYLCLGFWLLCFLGTGTDEKNIKSIASYPDEVINIVKSNSKLRDKIVSTPPLMKLGSNLVLFGVILYILCFFIRTDSFLYNFLAVLIMGQALNLFDLLVIDLLWWRNSKRVRFLETKDDKGLYSNPKKHLISFLKGIVLFTIIALIDGGLLLLF